MPTDFLRPVWMISVSWFPSRHVCYWQIGRKAVDICVFILYTALSLKESTAFMCLLVQSIGFYMFSITSSATKDGLVSVSLWFPPLVLELYLKHQTLYWAIVEKVNTQFVPDFSGNISEVCSSQELVYNFLFDMLYGFVKDFWSWRDNSVVKNTDYSSKGPGFDS